MGMGHVPPGALCHVGEGRHLQGRQRGGAPREGVVTSGRPVRPSIALGRAGEDLAAAWYEARGYAVVARNWRSAGGEIDLVARRGRLVVIVEVKARSSDRFGHPAEAVMRDKQLRLRRL